MTAARIEKIYFDGSENKWDYVMRIRDMISPYLARLPRPLQCPENETVNLIGIILPMALSRLVPALPTL